MSKFNIPTQSIPSLASAYSGVLGKDAENQIIEIPNEKIIENNHQNFIIHDDTVEQLAERIKKDGQLSPCIVTPLSDGNYELIDGRHRRRAVILAGLPTTKCIIKYNLTDKEKSTYRITLNVFRNNDYLPSELALSIKELVELEGSYDAIKKIADETSTNRKKIYRYLRLTNLIKPLLERVDNGNIPVIAAVELSYLTEEQQKKLFEFLLNHSECKINTALAREIKEAPNNLTEIFFGEKLDNLSNFNGGNILSNNDSSDFKNKNEVIDSHINKEANITSEEDIEINSEEDVDYNTRKVISEFVINFSCIDYYIIKEIFTPSEVINYFYENYVKSHSGGISNYNGISIQYNWNTYKNYFKLNLNNKSYVMKLKTLEKIIRQYIRKNYTVEKIIQVVKGVEKS